MPAHFGSPTHRRWRSHARSLTLTHRHAGGRHLYIKEMTMIEQQIEELRAELNACIEPAERREIEAELEIAQAELIMMLGEQDGSIDAEPPF
ncbi:hypothetical protein GFM01_34535 [Rhizobium laguerreae]|nr:hypothetical protein [Rhizobium laguerreae]NKM35913.1 hypothetical protein [Rhizobium laguerreae]